MIGVRVFEVSECVICWGDGVVPTTILKPCGHRCVCDVCLDYDGLCPMCREEIDNPPALDRRIIAEIMEKIMEILFGVLIFWTCFAILFLPLCIAECKTMSWEDCVWVFVWPGRRF